MPGQFVLDASVTLAWCFEEERNDYAERVLACLEESQAVVPSIWPLEVCNVLLIAERKKRIGMSDTRRFVAIIDALPIMVVAENTMRIFSEVISLARAQQLSTYDAAYLDLAMRLGLPLATRDRALQLAAERCAVAAYAPEG